jgi:hypothetical protein
MRLNLLIMGLFKKNQQPKFQPQPAHVKKDKASEYQAAGGDTLSYQALKFATWYVGHKNLLKKIGVGLLIFWCVVSVAYSGLRWAEYYIFGYWDDLEMVERQVAEVQNYEALRPLYAAQDLRFDRVQTFSAPGDKYDFVTMVQNPNERWLARVSFKYTFSGDETEVRNALLLPGASGVFAVLGHETTAFPRQVSLQVVDIDWDKIDAHQIQNVPAYVNERSMFSLGSVQFTRANRGGLPTSRLQFFLTNDSAYSFWQPLFYVLLLNGTRTEGVVTVTLDNFLSGEERAVDLRFLDTSLSISDVRVIPAVNVFEKSVFIDPGE